MGAEEAPGLLGPLGAHDRRRGQDQGAAPIGDGQGQAQEGLAGPRRGDDVEGGASKIGRASCRERV